MKAVIFKMCVVWRANGEDDFEQFLENVRERSLTARTKIAASQGACFGVSFCLFYCT